jgi:hypothetical protein
VNLRHVTAELDATVAIRLGERAAVGGRGLGARDTGFLRIDHFDDAQYAARCGYNSKHDVLSSPDPVLRRYSAPHGV